MCGQRTVWCSFIKGQINPQCIVQVYCNGEEVMTVSGTKEKYVVDVWSGNHPFFQVRCGYI